MAPQDGRAGLELSDPELEHKSTSNLFGPLPGCLEEPRPGRWVQHVGRALFGLEWAGALLAEPSASETPAGRIMMKEGEEEKGRGEVLTNALRLLSVAPIAGNVVAGSRPCIGALNVIVEAPLTVKSDHQGVLLEQLGDVSRKGDEVWIGDQSPMRSEEKEGQAAVVEFTLVLTLK
ncbi:hypothetical protein PPACK8108_LOCUS18266 [Phakopsora pachyrhizi]|uniref:Uncharacterized protein n=1 Tax=Phakopsora pachyrhizi TaxID=170000 RepID=A0AAV0BDN3_PHAPC|nr:hypothetical protein PPACK8108_LOCUS18266 [Phakopsora pachyrhizi]